jgi:KDO2-lipid IV(A) lauroyltransferase
MHMAMPKLSNSELNALVRKNYIHYGKLFIEFLLLLRLKSGDTNSIDKFFRCDNFPLLLEALKGSKGAILTGAHVGLWEALGPYLSRQNIPVTVTVKRVSFPLFQKLREVFQAHPGVSILDPTLGNKRAAYLLRSLRNNHLVGIFLDQYRAGEPFIPFLGHDARTNSTAAIIWRKTRAPIFLIHVIRESIGRYKIELTPVTMNLTEGGSDESDIRTISTHLNNVISEVIFTYPDQWLWAHRRFKENNLFQSVN